MERLIVLGLGALLSTSGCNQTEDAPRILPNESRQPAGSLEKNELTLQLEAREGRW